MKPAASHSRAKLLPCGCLCGPGILLNPLCPEAKRLWREVQALGSEATSLTPEYQEYAAHFKRKRRRP